MSNRLVCCVATAIFGLALGGVESAFAQEHADEGVSGWEISIVVEEGDKVPSQVLDTFAAQALDSGATAEVTFSVIEGQARLVNVDGPMADAVSGGSVAHPEIIPGPHYDETYVQMLADGKPFGKAVRIGTIASGSLDQLLAKDVPDGSAALLAKAPDYAVVDTGLLRSQTPVDKSAVSGQYCAGIFDKERDVYGHSRVLVEGCSDKSEEDALAQARSKAAASGASVNITTWLMTLYEHANYGGRSYVAVGCCGPCDPAGYTFVTFPLSYWFGWDTHMSSASRGTGSRCYRVQYRAPGDRYWSAVRGLPDPYVGSHYNDNIEVIHVFQ